MLSPKKLLECRNRPPPEPYAVSSKRVELLGTNFESAELKMKLDNMGEILSTKRVKMIGLLSKAVWCPELNMAEVTEKVGSFWDVMGHTENKKLYIFPEEALYLLENGSLELSYNSVPVSIQRAYSLFIETADMSITKYRVYSHLSALGYRVVRHSAKNVLTKYEKNIDLHKVGIKHCILSAEDEARKETILQQVETTMTTSVTQFSDRFPISLDSNETRENIFRKLRIVSPATFLSTSEGCLPELDFDIYLSSKEPFRKSTIQLPHYRVKVVPNDEPVPNEEDIHRLSNAFQDDVPVMFAIVYPDFISFLQLNPVQLPILA